MRRYSVVTFGCQMNMHDSERIEAVLRGVGLTEASEPKSADVVILNTCSVREKAEHKLRSEVGRLGLIKRTRPDLLIGVAGCVAQQEGERLTKSLPQIDFVVGPDNIREIPALLRSAELGSPAQVRTEFDYAEPHFLAPAPLAGARKASAFVTTMKGCDERCTFCIVPYTRGSERYRPSTDILDEVRTLVASGVSEVTLLGQTVDSYRDPEGQLAPASEAGEGIRRWGRRTLRPEDETEFPALLRAIAKEVPQLARLRYTSPHPRHLTPALVRAHQELPVLPRHVHMPVQSGSSAVLKRMGRRYTREEYLERTLLLQQSVPGLTLSTDVIVGFPGETRSDFAQTMSLVEQLQFIGIFAFKYSQRPFTAALNLQDDVPEVEKSERLAELLELGERIRRQHLQTLVGSRQTVLVEGLSKTGAYSGRSERNEIIHFGSSEDPTGELLTVEVTRALKHSLVGELVGDTRSVNYDDAVRQASLDGSGNKHVAAPGTRRGLPVLN